MNKVYKFNTNTDIGRIKSVLPDIVKCSICDESMNNKCQCVDYHSLRAFNIPIKMDAGLLSIIDRLEKPTDFDTEKDAILHKIQDYKQSYNTINKSFENMVKMSRNIINLYEASCKRNINYINLYETYLDFLIDCRHKITFNDDGSKTINSSLLKDYDLDGCFGLYENLSIVIAKK
jgi:hypothetical protein